MSPFFLGRVTSRAERGYKLRMNEKETLSALQDPCGTCRCNESAATGPGLIEAVAEPDVSLGPSRLRE